jgi:hypothetical protein
LVSTALQLDTRAGNVPVPRLAGFRELAQPHDMRVAHVAAGEDSIAFTLSLNGVLSHTSVPRYVASSTLCWRLPPHASSNGARGTFRSMAEPPPCPFGDIFVIRRAPPQTRAASFHLQVELDQGFHSVLGHDVGRVLRASTSADRRPLLMRHLAVDATFSSRR